MKTVFSLIQTKIALAILGVLLVIASFIGYQEVKERQAEIAAQKQQLELSLEVARLNLKGSQDVLESTRKSLQRITNQHKQKLIEEEGQSGYEKLVQELEQTVAEYQQTVQEDRQNIKQLDQKLLELELQPLFAF